MEGGGEMPWTGLAGCGLVMLYLYSVEARLVAEVISEVIGIRVQEVEG